MKIISNDLVRRMTLEFTDLGRPLETAIHRQIAEHLEIKTYRLVDMGIRQTDYRITFAVIEVIQCQ